MIIENSDRMLLSCLRRETREEQNAFMKKLDVKDWENILESSMHYGLTSFLYYTLNKDFKGLSIPDDVLQRMKMVYQWSLARHMHLYHQLSIIISKLNQSGISVILLKGAHLAGYVYDVPGLRPMVDIDLLAKKKDLIKIHDLLLDQGYKTILHDISHSKHLAPYSRPGAVSIEVHFNITTPPFSNGFEVEELWERSKKYDLDGVDVLTLSPEDILLHLCLHTCVHHGFDKGLIPFFDFIQIIEHYDGKLNWDVFFKRSHKWRAEKCVTLMFALTRNLFGMKIPEKYSDGIKTDSLSSEVLALAEEMIFKRHDNGEVRVHPSIARLFDRNVKWQDKLLLIHKTIFPRKDVLQISERKKAESSFMEKNSVYWRRIQFLLKDNSKIVWAALRKNPNTLLALETQNKRNHLKNWLAKVN